MLTKQETQARVQAARERLEKAKQARNIQRVQDVLDDPDSDKFQDMMIALRIYAELGIE
jgi:hypothetical protein